MISFEQAKNIANVKLLEIQMNSHIKLALCHEETIEFEYGWIFFYQSEEFLSTGNPLSMLGGNAPILIDKYNSIAIMTGTGRDIDYYIEVYSKFKSDWAR